jgi:hypothetical protein
MGVNETFLIVMIALLDRSHDLAGVGADHWPGRRGLPQVGETNTPRSMDAAGVPLLYDNTMTRVYLADFKPDERSALRPLLPDLDMGTEWIHQLINMNPI